ncbi:unnamed protein product [Linum trigynum]|uniref:Uncharacterized protein n=1 Tax=Linum trigynum TaxID=586398 RepID=A0AAV2CFS2_9ROSI
MPNQTLPISIYFWLPSTEIIYKQIAEGGRCGGVAGRKMRQEEDDMELVASPKEDAVAGGVTRGRRARRKWILGACLQEEDAPKKDVTRGRRAGRKSCSSKTL